MRNGKDRTAAKINHYRDQLQESEEGGLGPGFRR